MGRRACGHPSFAVSGTAAACIKSRCSTPSQVAGPGVEKHLQPLMLDWVNVTHSKGKPVLLVDGAQFLQAARVLESQTSVDAPMDIGDGDRDPRRRRNGVGLVKEPAHSPKPAVKAIDSAGQARAVTLL